MDVNNNIELDTSDIIVRVYTDDEDTIDEFLHKHIRPLLNPNIGDAVTYALYIQGWYDSRGVKLTIDPSPQCGWFMRFLMRVIIRGKRAEWDTPGYASRWLDTTKPPS